MSFGSSAPLNQPGARSNVGTPSGTWWKLCLSMVYMTTCARRRSTDRRRCLPSAAPHRDSGGSGQNVRSARRTELTSDRALEIAAPKLLRRSLRVRKARLGHGHDYVGVSPEMYWHSLQ